MQEHNLPVWMKTAAGDLVNISQADALLVGEEDLLLHAHFGDHIYELGGFESSAEASEGMAILEGLLPFHTINFDLDVKAPAEGQMQMERIREGT